MSRIERLESSSDPLARIEKAERASEHEVKLLVTLARAHERTLNAQRGLIQKIGRENVALKKKLEGKRGAR